MQLYHITPLSSAQSILSEGFQPRIGPRSAQLGETVPAVYLFNTAEDLHAAAHNWLSETFEDVDEPLIVLVIAVPGELVTIAPTAAYEATVTVPVPASAIVRAYDIDTGVPIAV